MDVFSGLAHMCFPKINMANLYVPMYRIGDTLLFRSENESAISRYAKQGWSFQEETHRWTDGPRAKLVFRLQNLPGADLIFCLKGFAFLGNDLSHQAVEFAVNGHHVSTWEISGLGRYDAVIPQEYSRGLLLEVTLAISNPRSPLETGVSMDPRKLGIAVEELVISEKGCEGNGIKKAHDNPPGPVMSRPACVIVETVNSCNFNCIFCAKRSLRREKTIMPMDLFKKIVQEYNNIGGGVLSLTPMIGDVFLDPLLLDRIQFVTDNFDNIHLSVTTNGVMSDKYNDAELDFILNAFHKVYISVYGLCENEFGRITDSNDYTRCFSSLQRIVKLIEPSKIAFGFRLIYRREEAEIKKWIENSFNTNISFGYTFEYNKWPNATLPEKLPGDALWAKRKNGSAPCLVPLIAMQIFANGNVSLCACADFNSSPELKLGSVLDTSLESIINQDKVLNYFSSYLEIPEICRKCSFYYPIPEVQPGYVDNPLSFIGG